MQHLMILCTLFIFHTQKYLRRPNPGWSSFFINVNTNQPWRWFCIWNFCVMCILDWARIMNWISLLNSCDFGLFPAGSTQAAIAGASLPDKKTSEMACPLHFHTFPLHIQKPQSSVCNSNVFQLVWSHRIILQLRSQGLALETQEVNWIAFICHKGHHEAPPWPLIHFPSCGWVLLCSREKGATSNMTLTR